MVLAQLMHRSCTTLSCPCGAFFGRKKHTRARSTAPLLQREGVDKGTDCHRGTDYHRARLGSIHIRKQWASGGKQKLQKANMKEQHEPA